MHHKINLGLIMQVQNNIEADYLVDKLAGRLKEYAKIPNNTTSVGRWNLMHREIDPVMYDYAKKECKNFEWRIESLEEYRQRKEQERKEQA